MNEDLIYYINYVADDLKMEAKALGSSGLKILDGKKYPLSELSSGQFNKVTILVTTFSQIDSKFLSAFPRCKLVIRHGSGYDNVDLKACANSGVAVMNIKNYCLAEISRYCVEIIGDYQKDSDHHESPVIGIIGLGQVGQSIYKHCLSLGYGIETYDRRSSFENLQKLLERSDIITLHAALNQSSLYMIGQKEFQHMKPGTWLINTARGRLIETRALLEALNTGRVGQTFLDVIDDNVAPELQRTVLGHENVHYTGHTAWYSPESLNSIRTRIVNAALAWFQRGIFTENLLTPIGS